MTSPAWFRVVEDLTAALTALENAAALLRKGEAIRPGSPEALAIQEAVR